MKNLLVIITIFLSCGQSNSSKIASIDKVSEKRSVAKRDSAKVTDDVNDIKSPKVESKIAVSKRSAESAVAAPKAAVRTSLRAVSSVKAKSDDSYIDITSRGAKGDGVFDNWQIIQQAIDELINKGGGTIYIPKGAYAIYDKSLAIWGDNISIKGEAAASTSVIKKGKVGFFGDCIDICGKINNYQYYGDFGNGNYKSIQFYRGETISAHNVTISNLTITSDLQQQPKLKVANNLGILNCADVKIENCIITNAPQTDVAIVNDTKQCKNGKVELTNCIFSNSGQHNVRVISYNQGPFVGNNVIITSCQFQSTRDLSSNTKELNDKKVLLWYRGGTESGSTSLTVTGSKFDDSGMVYASGNVNGLSITNCDLDNDINIQHTAQYDQEPSIIIQHNRFKTSAKKEAYFNGLRSRYGVQKMNINGFVKTNFGSIYPGNLMNKSRTRSSDNSAKN